MKFFHRLRHIDWTRPIVRQWPLMLAWVVLVGWESLIKNPFPRWMIIFLHAYLVALLVEWSRSRVIKGIVYAVIYLLFFTELWLSWLFGMHISPGVLVLLAETNGRESVEFLESLTDQPGFWRVLACLLAAVLLNVMAERNQERLCRWLGRFGKTTRLLRYVAAVMLLCGMVTSVNYVNLLRCEEPNDVDEWRSHMRNPDDSLTKLFVSIYDICLAKHEMEKACRQAEQVEVVAQTATNDSLNIILVIGESYIRDHASIYGYPLATTPFLVEEQRQGRLFAFTDVVSPYNQTTKVMRNLLCCNSLGDEEKWTDTPPLMAVFKRNGYWVGMEDNQKAMGLSDLFSFSLNAFLYHPRMMTACYDVVNDSTFEFDGQLVDYCRRQHLSSNKATHRLLLFHLLGQHIGFRYRYPQLPYFQHFSADSLAYRKESWIDPEMQEEIAHYDNATRYNNYVIQKIAALYKEENTVLVMLADHGEEVYDYRPRYGRDDWKLGDSPADVLRWQYSVPFVVWCSDRYRALHPALIEELQHATTRPMMIDNTCQLLFKLAGLQTPYYNSSRDVTSDDYRCPPRVVNDVCNYDSIMQAAKQ